MPRDGNDWYVIVAAAIRKLILPVTAVCVIFALGFFIYTKIPAGQPEITVDAFAGLLVLVSFSAVSTFFPAIAVVYGWHTGNRAGAVLLGLVPFPVIFLLAGAVVSHSGISLSSISRTILFVAALSCISGLAGLCAARKTRYHLAAAFILTGLWFFCWMNAIN